MKVALEKQKVARPLARRHHVVIFFFVCSPLVGWRTVHAAASLFMAC